ncbi:integrase catalytic subunit (plasmid) [Ralstonia solanacearum Po82]|uniref:Integrase catalytic subunit n=1 Tax=Ralstonia solanacearum (strain Po82) TaxID=1031711 RepID=F6GB52_RALS8|nr:integrase catalytic subunit [Ralstonia solanacearum Po82]
MYGAGKVWKQMRREDIRVAHCPVERLTRRLGLHGHTR